LIFPATARAAVYTWNGTVGDWENALRWIPNGVPGGDDTVYISGGTVNVDSFGNFYGVINLSGGTLNLETYVDMYGILNWSGGGLTGVTLTIEPAGTLNISNSVTLDAPLLNLGTVNWAGGNIYLDTCSDSGAGPVVNEGLWNIECDATNLSCEPGVNAYFLNGDGGVVVKENTTGTTYFMVPFTNTAWVETESGNISMGGGGLLTGDFVVATNTEINFSGGYFPLSYTAPVATGAGLAQFTGSSTVSFLGGVRGVLNMAGGAIAGPLTIVGGATLNITGSVTVEGALTNMGTVNWLGGNVYLQTCSYPSAGPVVNAGQWNIQSGQYALSCGAGGTNAYFTNAGMVLKSNATGTTYISLPFANSGTVQAVSGIISLESGGVLGGSFVAEAGAGIDFDGGNFPLAAAAPAASGAGLVQFTGSGGISFSQPMTGVLNCAGGIITQPLTVTGAGTLNINGIGVTLNSALTNEGTVNWLGGNIYMAVCDAGPLVNLPGAQWNIQSGLTNSCICPSGPNAEFINEGKVLKTVGTDYTFFSIAFTNSGTVEADTGAIVLEQGGALGGSFVAEAGAAIDFDGGSFPLAGAAPAASGSGLVQFTGNAGISFSGPMTGVLNLAGGIIGGPLTIAANGTNNILGNVTVDSALTNLGTVNWLGGNIFMDTLDFPLAGPVMNLGQWNIQCDNPISDNNPSVPYAYFTNAGAVLKSNATGTTAISIPFNNSGTLQADSGNFALEDGGVLNGSFVAKAGAAIYFEGGSFPLAGAAPAAGGPGLVQFTGSAMITCSGAMSGVINLAGGTLAGPFTIAANGTNNILGSVTVDAALTNLGTVNWLGGNIYFDTCHFPLAGPVVNQGQWNIECDMTNLSCLAGANAYFNNGGTVLKTNSAGTTLFSLPFNNSGTLAADTGTLELMDGGSLGGEFVTEPGAAIEFVGGTFSLAGNAPAASGGGQVQFANNAGILFTGPMTGVVNCAGGAIAGPLIIAGSGMLNISGSVSVEGALTNSGTVNWLGGNIYLDTCTSNLAGPVVNLGQWNILCDATNLSCQSGPNAYFINGGTVLKSNTAGTTLISIPFNNSGTLQADSGTVALLNGGMLNGLFVAETNAAIDFEAGIFGFNGAAPAGGGTGLVQFTSTAASITCIGPMTGVLNCAGATLAGPLTTAIGSTLNITGSIAVDSALTNGGTVNWLGGNIYLDTCSYPVAGPVVNLGQWNIGCDSTNLSCSPGPNAYFINEGTVLKTNTSGTTLLAIAFDNFGTLQADSGTLELTDGGALGGLFVAEANTAIDFEAGNFTLAGAAPAGSGTGVVQFTSTAANITCSGTMTGVLNCAGATFAGPLATAGGSTLNISGSVAVDGALTNGGTVNWLGGNIYLDTCAYPLAGPLVNLGQWNIQCDTANLSCKTGVNAYFLNEGTVLKTNTAGTTIVSIPFNSSGTLQVDSGTLELTNGGALGGELYTAPGATAAFDGGSFSMAGNLIGSESGLVQFGGTSGVAFNGPVTGVLNFAAGTITGPLTVAGGGTLNLFGSVALEGALTNSGTVNWLEGNVYLDTCTSNLAGPVVNLGQWNIQFGQYALSCGAGGANAYFTNAGTVLKTNDTGTTYFSIPFNNSGTLAADAGTLELTGGGALGGLFVAETNTAIDFESGNFTLNGAAPAGSGPGLVQFTGINANITCGGPMSGVLNCSLATLAGPLTIAPNGTLNITGIGVALNSSLTNHGTVNWLSGIVFLNSLYFPLTGPVVNLPGGLWNIQCDQSVSDNYTVAGDYFTNAGTVLKTNTTGTTTLYVPFFNSGTVQADTGTILFDNGYAETASANFLISLGGPTPGGGYGQIEFNYAPTFAGALSVNTRNGYVPAPGAVFTVLDYPGFAGAFSSTNLNLNDGMVLQPQFTAGALTLTAATASAPQLSISFSGGSAAIQWTPGFSGWVLQSATNLSGLAPVWTPLSATGNSTVVPVTGTQQYFRLYNGN
jgi:hypothetical protein